MAGWENYPELAENGQVNDRPSAETGGFDGRATPGKIASPRLKLGSVADVKRELARLYREARRGEITTQTATRLAYLLNMMAQLIETTELEKRVTELERLGAGR